MKGILAAIAIGLLFLLAANIERPDTNIYEYICDDGQVYSYEADTLIPEAEVCPQN